MKTLLRSTIWPAATAGRGTFEHWALRRFSDTVNFPKVSAFELKHAGLLLGQRRRAIRAAFGNWKAWWSGIKDAQESAFEAGRERR